MTDKTEGTKHDNGKAPWDLLPWDAVEQVVLVLRFGAQKYAQRNWEKGLAHSRTFAATQRHLVDYFQRGIDADPETGLHPLAHAACEVLFALAFAVRGTAGVDDRPTARPPNPAADIRGLENKPMLPYLEDEQATKAEIAMSHVYRGRPRKES